MHSELEALTSSNTWMLTTLPPDNNPLVVNGFTKSSIVKMIPSKAIRLNSWLKDILKLKRLVIMILSHP